IEQLPQAPKLLSAQVTLAHQLCEKELRGSSKDLVDHTREGAPPGSMLCYARRVTVRAPFDGVSHIALALQRAEHCEHGGIRELVAQRIPDFGDGTAPSLPENRHHVQFTIGKRDLHGVSSALDQLIL